MNGNDDLFSGHNVPWEIKKITKCIMKRYTIFGVCDGMYISNVIGYESGIGDGEGRFSEYNESNIQNKRKRIAERLQHAYGCNIRKEDIPELEEILATGTLDTAKAKKGLREFIQACYREKKRCPEYRKDYLTTCITEANLSLHEI